MATGRSMLVGAWFAAGAAGLALPVAADLSASPAAAIAASPKSSSQAKAIEAGTAHFPPFVIVDGDKISGLSAEVVRTVFQRLGYQVNLQAYPWTRTQKLAMTGKPPIIFTFTRSPEREQYFYFSEPIASVKDVLFKKKNSKIAWTKLKDLEGMVVGLSQGYSYAPEFMQLIAGRSVKPDYGAGKAPELIHLRKLSKGRLDVFICEASVCSYLIKKHPKEFGDIDFINRIVGPVRPFHVGFSRADPRSKKLQQDFDKIVREMAKSGELDRLHRRHGLVSVVELSP